FKGGVTLADQNGNIALHAAGPPTSPINVSAKNGDIILALPPGSRFSLDAFSSHGEVNSDFTGPGLVINSQGDAPSIKGALGHGGPDIRLSTTYGVIHLVRENPASAPNHGASTATEAMDFTLEP
ncbi:MAG: hypothetical protein KGM47_04515, partial [Acidobacteriota bacterium]|nr:hypothetical protein [Acidobacteriota bacterium]